MKDNLGRIIYSLALIAVAFIWADQNTKNHAAEQKALNVRAQYEERVAYWKAKSTNDLVSVFQKVDPLPKFGCPVSGGVWIKQKGKKIKVC